MEIINRSATYEYFIEARMEAGMVLTGTEVKSIREGKVSFNDAYCYLDKGELFIKSLHISEYSHGGYHNHDPLRVRKLLLHKKELKKLDAKTREKGNTIVPLKIYFNEKGKVKMEIGLAKGKKLHDKREAIRNRDVEREIRKHLK